MTQSTLADYQSTGAECPTCGEVFDSTNGMKTHHVQAHGESIAGVAVDCASCGERIRRNPSRYEEVDRHFCSPECEGEWRSDVFTGENNPSWNGGKVSVECETCGDTVRRHPSDIESNERNFCSLKCRYKWQETLTGADNPHWRGGYSIYDAVKKQLPGQSWWRRKEEAKERDGYTCQSCGATGCKLDTHHIIPVMTGGTNGFWNLMTLCVSCHNKVEEYIRQYPEFDPVLVDD